MATVPKKQKESFGADLKKIWQAETKKDAIELKDAFVEKYADKFDKAVECLEEGFEDSIQYYGFSKIDSRKISSTNTLERLNKEVRRLKPCGRNFSKQRILSEIDDCQSD